jgi:uncharacterized damage-inducible protein DinB
MERDEALKLLAAFPALLRETVRELSDAELRFRPAPGEWSAVEIIGHYIDVDLLWQQRIGHMSQHDNPHFPPADNEQLVIDGRYQEKDAAGLLFRFAELRAETVEALRMIHPNNFARPAVHATRGPITIGDIFTILPGHDQNHMAQIAANLAAARAG